jgi:response regulator RpfG family c-di-GMP phosphodiesterase
MGRSGGRNAALVGFPRGLEDALAELLGAQGLAVFRLETETEAAELLLTTKVELVVASGRCTEASVMRLVDVLGAPRTTRVLVLLTGRDIEAERRYREAGVHFVMTMPVTVEDLLRAGGPAASRGLEHAE